MSTKNNAVAELLPDAQSAPKRILVATLGSLGDLHPCIALALELKRRGHQLTIASTEHYRQRVESLGLGFTPIRPNWDPTDSELITQCEDLKTGPEVLFRKLVLPHLQDSYDDLIAPAADADLIIASELVFAIPLIAEKLGKRWASVTLSPTSFFSAHDPSLLVNVPSLYRLRRAGWIVNRAFLNFGRVASRHWWNPVRDLRRQLGLNPACDPVFKDKFSPSLVLALFSNVFAQPQPDWPRQTIQPGFVFHDAAPRVDYDPSLLNGFLRDGAPPIVFTLGSTAVHNPGNFYQASLAAARSIKRRAVLIGVKDQQPADDLLALPYVPFSEIFPHAAAIVHQGGSGTTGQALRVGRPQLIVPYAWDQPDNGVRIARLGAGLTLARSRYTPETATQALRTLLEDKRFTAKASHAAAHLSSENALGIACNAVEALN
jgi:rhamnosyltransferase subunit B